jgi:hypothetical protein
MRGLAYLTPEAPRFTATGSLEVVMLGLLWGAVTAPMLRPLARRIMKRPSIVGMVHGALVFGTALVGFLIVTGGVGSIVAPASFIVLGVTMFPLLFLLHGMAVAVMSARWRRLGP